MYSILHLPSNTMYSIKNNNNKHSVLYFKKYDNAKYIADSLATYKWIYDKFPTTNKDIYVMKQYQKKRDALESKLWVKKTNLTCKNLRDLATRNVDIFYIKDLDWVDDENFNIRGKNIEFTSTLELIQLSLENDYQILIE